MGRPKFSFLLVALLGGAPLLTSAFFRDVSLRTPSSRALPAGRRRGRRHAPLVVARSDLDGVRKKVFTALRPLDRGDFRWEFLVPSEWRDDKDLTTREKIIVCSTFIGIAICLQELFDTEASVGVHLSYIAQFFSYAIGNPIGFRIIAIVSSLLEVLGDLLESAAEKEDAIPVVYNILFIPINSYYVIRWLLNREAGTFTEEEEALYSSCFAPLGFARGQFARVLEAATFEQATNDAGEERDGVVCEGGVTLCTEGEPLKELFVAVNGTVDVVVGGVVAARIPPYQLIGEASLLENLQSEGGNFHQPARATIVAEPGAFFVRWRQRSFFELQAKDPEIAYTIQLMIARTLSSKLRSARISQQTTVERDASAQPQLVAPLRSPAEQDLYAECFEGLGVTQDQYTRLLSLATFGAATSMECCGGAVKLVEEGESWSRIIIPISGALEADVPDLANKSRRRVAYPLFNAIETATSLAAISATMPDGDEARQEFLAFEPKKEVRAVLKESVNLFKRWEPTDASAAASAEASDEASVGAGGSGEGGGVESGAACTAEARAPARRVRTRREVEADKYIGAAREGAAAERNGDKEGEDEEEGGEEESERPMWVFPQAKYDVLALEGSRWASWTVTDLVGLMVSDPELEQNLPMLLTAAFDPAKDAELMAAAGRPRRGPDGYIDLSDLDIGLI